MNKKINYTRIAYHLLFWTAFLLYRLTITTTEKSLIGDYWWGDLKILHVLFVEILCKAAFAYGLLYAGVPRLLDKKKYLLFGCFTFVWLYLVCAVYIAIHYYYLEKIYTIYMWWDNGQMVSLYKRLSTWQFIFHTFSKFLFSTLVFGAIKYYKGQMTFSRIEEEKNRMELQVLKNQLNPHFLFNTLNNLYSFVVTGSEKAPDMILRLSGMLDYVLYKSQHKNVPLQEEVDAIEHFIELEKIRYGERLEVNYSKTGNMSVPILPLLLLSLVENAFKHGASGDIDTPKIDIDIQVEKEHIYCTVSNTKSQDVGEINDAYKEGIGMSNMQRQLNLVYPDKHTMLIEDLPDTFTVSLQINIPS